MAAINFTLGHHLVAFLDVLGQRERFRALQLPRNAEEQAQVKEVLRQTAGFVLGLRQTFRSQFETFEKGVSTGIRIKTFLRPRFIGFSDSFVTSVPLRNEGDELVPIIAVFSALSAAAVVMLVSLCSQHPLRGGIDVGLATEVGPEEIYGTALERAYVLESNVAGYPRIVIGGELWKYLNAVIAHFNNVNTPNAKSITEIAQKVFGLITIDSDGKRILDYLGRSVLAIAPPATKEHMVQPAYEFIVNEYNRMMVEKKPKLIERYVSLRNYFESRLSLWEIPLR